MEPHAKFIHLYEEEKIPMIIHFMHTTGTNYINTLNLRGFTNQHGGFILPLFERIAHIVTPNEFPEDEVWALDGDMRSIEVHSVSNPYLRSQCMAQVRARLAARNARARAPMPTKEDCAIEGTREKLDDEAFSFGVSDTKMKDENFNSEVAEGENGRRKLLYPLAYDTAEENIENTVVSNEEKSEKVKSEKEESRRRGRRQTRRQKQRGSWIQE